MLRAEGLVEGAAYLAGELRVAELASGVNEQRVPLDLLAVGDTGRVQRGWDWVARPRSVPRGWRLRTRSGPGAVILR